MAEAALGKFKGHMQSSQVFFLDHYETMFSAVSCDLFRNRNAAKECMPTDRSLLHELVLLIVR